jgi:hypothetical protein
MRVHVAEAVDGEDGIHEYTIFRPSLGEHSDVDCVIMSADSAC